MIHEVFSIFDHAAEAYLPPFVLHKTAMAQRVFSDCINSPDHQFNKNPGDYTLFYFGTWDDNNCHFEHLPNGPHPLGNGLEYVKPPQSVGQKDLLTDMEVPENGNGEASLSDEAPVLPIPIGEDSPE